MFIYQTHWSCKKKRSKLNEIHIVTVLILNKVNINKEFHQWYSTVSVYIMQCNNWSEHSDLTTSWHFNTGIIHTRAQLVCRLSELKNDKFNLPFNSVLCRISTQTSLIKYQSCTFLLLGDSNANRSNTPNCLQILSTKKKTLKFSFKN